MTKPHTDAPASKVETGAPVETDGDAGDKNVQDGKASQAHANAQDKAAAALREGQNNTDPEQTKTPIAGGDSPSVKAENNTDPDGGGLDDDGGVGSGDMPIAEARARLKQERGMTDAAVMSMNDKDVYDALNNIHEQNEKRKVEADADRRRNEDYQRSRPGTVEGTVEGTPPVIGNSGYNRRQRAAEARKPPE